MLKHKDLTDKILSAFYAVYNEMGHGFLEKVYQNSMYLALKEAGLNVEAQKRIMVYYKGKEVGEYFADLVVNGVIIIELKACSTLLDEHVLQLVNYLKATEIEIGLLLNFGLSPRFERRMWFNN